MYDGCRDPRDYHQIALTRRQAALVTGKENAEFEEWGQERPDLSRCTRLACTGRKTTGNCHAVGLVFHCGDRNRGDDDVFEQLREHHEAAWPPNVQAPAAIRNGLAGSDLRRLSRVQPLEAGQARSASAGDETPGGVTLSVLAP